MSGLSADKVDVNRFPDTVENHYCAIDFETFDLVILSSFNQPGYKTCRFW